MQTHCVYCEAETEFLYPYMKINIQSTSGCILRCFDYITIEHRVVRVYLWCRITEAKINILKKWTKRDCYAVNFFNNPLSECNKIDKDSSVIPH
jgi:hypothetical protein